MAACVQPGVCAALHSVEPTALLELKAKRRENAEKTPRKRRENLHKCPILPALLCRESAPAPLAKAGTSSQAPLKDRSSNDLSNVKRTHIVQSARPQDGLRAIGDRPRTHTTTNLSIL